MKKNILSMAVLLMASAAVFTACSSDDDITGEQPANPTGKYTMTVNASKGGDATTRALTLGRNDANTKNVLNATWNENEVVLVYQNGSQIGTLYSAASTTNETTLTGTLDSAPDAAQALTLYFHTATTNPSATDYAGQDGTLAKIASTYDFCAPATITAGSFTVSGSTVSTNSSASFGANQQSVVKFTLKDKNSETLLNAGTVRVQATYGGYREIFDIVFTIPDNTYTTNGNGVIYLAIPNTGSYFSKLLSSYGYDLTTIKNSCRLNITATVGSDTYTYTKSGWPFDDGKYYEITVKMTKQAAAVPDGAINGKFSVSATKQVYFSKGNLRYASSKWSFFDNQYDYYTSYSADAWDKFCWSTSVTTYGMNTSKDNSTYSGDFVDWGATMGTGWFTLSSDEWTYVFNTRTTGGTVFGTSSGRYAHATINTDGTSVNGMILFPDGVDIASTEVTTAGSVNATSKYATKCTTAQWSALAAKGCVFLPAAGFRWPGTGIADVGSIGDYWSSSPNGASNAYAMQFISDILRPAYNFERSYGFSVRLVRQVE